MAGEGTADRVRELLGLPVRHGVPSPPRVVVRLRGAVPGSVVRIVAALLVVAMAVLSGAPGLLVVLAVAAGGSVLWRPQWPVAPVVLVVAGFVVLAGPDLLAVTGSDGGGLLRASGLVLCGHLMLRFTTLAGRIAWRGRVDRAVLAVLARSLVGIQLVVQGSLLAVVWLRSGLGGGVAGQGWLRLLAAAAVVAVALLVVPREWMRERPRRGD